MSLPVLIPAHAGHTWLSEDGEVETLDGRQVALRLRSSGPRPLVCHGPATARRLHCAPKDLVDVLSLFAFVRPARWCVPTPGGLAEALGLPRPQDPAEQALALIDVAQMLIRELTATPGSHRDRTIEQLWLAKATGWAFAEPCLHAFGSAALAAEQNNPAALKVWRHLPKWEDVAPPGRPGERPG